MARKPRLIHAGNGVTYVANVPKAILAIRKRHGEACFCILCRPQEIEPAPLLSNRVEHSISCEKCQNSPSTALWALFTKSGKRYCMNLCASCGMGAAQWMKMWTPPASDDGPSEPVFFHPYVRSEVLGKPLKMGRNRPRMPYNQRSPAPSGKDTLAQLEAWGITVPLAIRQALGEK